MKKKKPVKEGFAALFFIIGFIISYYMLRAIFGLSGLITVLISLFIGVMCAGAYGAKKKK